LHNIATHAGGLKHVVAYRPQIVGRRLEIDALEAALNSTKLGKGRSVGLFGEPGIGKSTLASYASNIFAEKDFNVLRGYCLEDDGTPAYWPWVEILRDLLSDLTHDEAASLVGDQAPLLAEILPDTSRFLPPETPAPSFSSSNEFRFRLFDALAQILKRSASIKPLLLIVEDIHWADEGTLHILGLMSNSISSSPISLIITSRENESAENPEAFSTAVGDMMRQQVFTRIDLERLSRDATAQQIANLGGDQSSGRILDDIYASTDGNPFFTSEGVRLLAQENRLNTGSTEDIEIGIPGGVTEVIGQRLRWLDENEMELLRTCSVIGQEIELELLAKVTEKNPSELFTQIERLIANQVMTLDGATLRFTHALIGESVASGLPPNELVSRNAKVGDALAEYAGDNVRPYVQRIAAHSVISRPVTGEDRATKFSLLAGDEALRLSELDSARRHYNVVLDITSKQPINDSIAHAKTGLWKVESRAAHESEIVVFVKMLIEAFNYYVANGMTSQAIDLAASASTPYASTRGIDDVIARAIDLATPGSLEYGKLAARKITSAYMEHRAIDEAENLFDTAVGIARKHSDQGLELAAIMNMAGAIGHSDLHVRNIDLIERGLQLANEISDTFTESILLFQGLIWRLEVGDPATAHRYEARRIIGEALKINSSAVLPILTAVRLEFDTGNFEEANRLLDTLASSATAATGIDPYSSSILEISLSRNYEITADERHLLRARDLADSAISAGAPTGAAERHHQSVLLMVAVEIGDPELAAEHYSVLRESQSGGAFSIWTNRSLAGAAALLGNYDDAELIHNDAIALKTKAEYFPELA